MGERGKRISWRIKIGTENFNDKIVKAIIFVWRYLSGKWTKFQAI